VNVVLLAACGSVVVLGVEIIGYLEGSRKKPAPAFMVAVALWWTDIAGPGCNVYGCDSFDLVISETWLRSDRRGGISIYSERG